MYGKAGGENKMEIIREVSLGDEVRAVIKRAQETGQPVEITNEHGQVIARVIPALQATEPQAYTRAWAELDRLIDAITPHLPEHVDAVQAIRDVRR
jgi:antitoxin (DNA-binding transcriptional repressor) of toxin-antitoxin stability system